MAREDWPCHEGLQQPECRRRHIITELRAAPNGRNFHCPVAAHADHHASFSINPGDVVRMVFSCKAGCDPGDIREALLGLGIHESCIGKYGSPRRNLPGAPMPRTADAATVADARRFQAVLKLPADLNGALLHMCIQAIADGDGNLPGDPLRLLPADCKEFVALAQRAGVKRTYAYTIFAKWIGG